MKLKIYKAKDMINRTKWQPTEIVKDFLLTSYAIDDCYINIKKLNKLDFNKPNNPIKNVVQIKTQNSE